MGIKRELTAQEEEVIYKASDDFQDYGKTEILCPICQGELKYIGNNASFAISCEHCGIIYSIRGL